MKSQSEASFNIPDSLKSNTLKELEDKYNFFLGHNVETAETYALSYITLSKERKDTLSIAKGLDLLYELYRYDPKALSISDEIINITKNQKKSIYPARGYFRKATFYLRNGNYQLAFKNYLETDKYAKINKNLFLEKKVSHSIGLLKNAVGEEKEALQFFEGYHDFISSHKEDHKIEYLVSLLSLSDSYHRNNKYKKCIELANVGILESTQPEHKRFYRGFTLITGIGLFFNDQNDLAIEKLKQAKELYEENDNDINLINCYLYLGKAYEQSKDYNKSIHYYKKVDFAVSTGKNIPLSTREAYEKLVIYYKGIGDRNNQLKYIEKLLHVDSIIESTKKELLGDLVKKYETPQLLDKHKVLVNHLENKNNVFLSLTISSIIVIVILFIVLFYYRKKRIEYRKRFDELIKNEKKEKSNTKSSKKIDIADNVVENILQKLDEFEKNKGFTKSNITVNGLSNEFKTNSSYLSKVINSYKEKGFSLYLNELRVNYAIIKLKEDKMFRKFTINSIAKEVGFNSSESFSRAFKNNTGIYPSYFIKNLENN